MGNKNKIQGKIERIVNEPGEKEKKKREGKGDKGRKMKEGG